LFVYKYLKEKIKDSSISRGAKLYILKSSIERRVKMTTEAKIQLTSTELGRLWMTYQIKTSMLVVFKQFRDTTIDEEAKSILNSSVIENQKVISEMTKIFINQNTIVPNGFDDRDRSSSK